MTYVQRWQKKVQSLSTSILGPTGNGIQGISSLSGLREKLATILTRLRRPLKNHSSVEHFNTVDLAKKIVLELVAYCRHKDERVAFNREQRDIAGIATERDDEFALRWVIVGHRAAIWIAFDLLEGRINRLTRRNGDLQARMLNLTPKQFRELLVRLCR